MLSKRRCFAALFTFLIAGSALAQTLQISVGNNVQVSVANKELDHGEVLVAADPEDPNKLVGCSMIFPDPLTRRISDGITYASSDRGATWKQTLYVDSGPMGSGDPACTFGPHGNAYSVILQPAVKPEMDDVLVYRSPDGGKTWENPSHIDWIDREYVTADTTGGKYNGRLYINGTGSAALLEHSLGDPEMDSAQIGISIQRSLDGGPSFRPPYKRYSAPPRWVLGMGNGVVLSDGTYIAVFGEQKDRTKLASKPPYDSANSFLKVISSSDGGETYSTARTISDWYMDYGDIGGDSSIVPVIAVDKSHGPFHDRLYVVWPDYRSGRGEILLSYSSDKGKTWSKPHVVNDDRAWEAPEHGPDDDMPVVDVNKNGIVGVMWYDRRDNPHNYGWWVRFAASGDGGETFGPSVRVSTAPATVAFQNDTKLHGVSMGGGKPESRQKGGNLQARIGFGTFFTFNGGHTAGMAADAGGTFHPFWIDNRTGVEQIWTAAVAVNGSAVVNGEPQFARLQDVTDDVTLDFKNAKYDRQTGELSVDAYLGNTSDKTLKPPLFIRVLSLGSKIGSPTVENAFNKKTREGAVWDFTPELPDKTNGLPPEKVSAPKRLVFHLADVHWGGDPPSVANLTDFLSFEGKALGSETNSDKNSSNTTVGNSQ